MASVFTKIINRELPSKIVYEDDLVIAFHDIQPIAPVHILIVPKKEIATVNDVTEADEPALGRMFTVAARVAREFNIAESGYRLVTNCNSDGGQEVFHIHMHLMGGERIGPMRARTK